MDEPTYDHVFLATEGVTGTTQRWDLDAPLTLAQIRALPADEWPDEAEVVSVELVKQVKIEGRTFDVANVLVTLRPL